MTRLFLPALTVMVGLLGVVQAADDQDKKDKDRARSTSAIVTHVDAKVTVHALE